VDRPSISYAQHASVTSEAEASVLSAVYSFIIKSSQTKRKAGGSNAGGDDARKAKDACTAEEKYTRA
jgi:hypothetical protein